jgi:signal peptidase I
MHMTGSGRHVASAAGEPAKGARRGWVAVVLALIAAVLGMLYVGRPRRAAMYLAVTLLLPVGAFALARNGLWPAALPLDAVFAVLAIVGAIDAYRIATRHSSGFIPRWYATPKGLIAIAAGLLGAVIGTRVFLFEPFRTPSVAMVPTLKVGDQFFVNKLAFLRTPPRRGDVVVFRLPATGVAYLKRVIGLPGDVVDYDAANSRLSINGSVVDVERLGPYPGDEGLSVARETLDGRSHMIALTPGRRSFGGSYPVPDDHYFVLGDNRDNSRDSRFPDFGFVPAESILGRVTFVWWNEDEPDRAGAAP